MNRQARGDTVPVQFARIETRLVQTPGARFGDARYEAAGQKVLGNGRVKARPIADAELAARQAAAERFPDLEVVQVSFAVLAGENGILVRMAERGKRPGNAQRKQGQQEQKPAGRRRVQASRPKR